MVAATPEMSERDAWDSAVATMCPLTVEIRRWLEPSIAAVVAYAESVREETEAGIRAEFDRQIPKSRGETRQRLQEGLTSWLENATGVASVSLVRSVFISEVTGA